MNIQTEEQSLAKYHVLHLVLGAIFCAIFLVVPKLIVVLLATLLVAIMAVLAFVVLTFAAVLLILRAAVPALSALRDQGD